MLEILVENEKKKRAKSVNLLEFKEDLAVNKNE